MTEHAQGLVSDVVLFATIAADNGKLIGDPDHSEDEDRFVLLGLSSTLRMLLVCHCYRAEGNISRIISARKASAKESQTYA